MISCCHTALAQRKSPLQCWNAFTTVSCQQKVALEVFYNGGRKDSGKEAAPAAVRKANPPRRSEVPPSALVFLSIYWVTGDTALEITVAWHYRQCLSCNTSALAQCYSVCLPSSSPLGPELEVGYERWRFGHLFACLISASLGGQNQWRKGACWGILLNYNQTLSFSCPRERVSGRWMPDLTNRFIILLVGNGPSLVRVLL